MKLTYLLLMLLVTSQAHAFDEETPPFPCDHPFQYTFQVSNGEYRNVEIESGVCQWVFKPEQDLHIKLPQYMPIPNPTPFHLDDKLITSEETGGMVFSGVFNCDSIAPGMEYYSENTNKWYRVEELAPNKCQWVHEEHQK